MQMALNRRLNAPRGKVQIGETDKVHPEMEKRSTAGGELTAVDPDEEARKTLITILLQFSLKRLQQVGS